MASYFHCICIPTYNRVNDLRECLDALTPQVNALPDTEILISDNASADATAELVRSYRAQCPRIRYHRQPSNLGFDANVRTCVQLADAEYMSLLGDDDIYPPGLLARLNAELRRWRPVVLYINHVPFLQRAPEVRLVARAPTLDQDYQSGRDFFLERGLGFISSLTWHTATALDNLPPADQKPYQTHVAIAAAMCLRVPGLFCYRGTAHVLARYVEQSRYSGFTACYLNVHLLYGDLMNRGLLDALDYTRLVTRDKFQLPRYYLMTKCSVEYEGECIRVAPIMRSLYGRYWWFYVILFPLMVLPRSLIRPPYLLARKVYQQWRLNYYA